MTITSWDEAEQALQEVRRWYIGRISQAARDAGGMAPLSRTLGHPDDYVERIHDHGSWQQQRKLVREIEDL